MSDPDEQFRADQDEAEWNQRMYAEQNAPEELAELADKYAGWVATEYDDGVSKRVNRSRWLSAQEDFLAGYRARDTEIKELRKQLSEYKALADNAMRDHNAYVATVIKTFDYETARKINEAVEVAKCEGEA